MGLEDAAVLAAKVKQEGVSEEALRSYERARAPRWRAVTAQTLVRSSFC